MTSVELHPQPGPRNDEYYNDDDVLARNSPSLVPMKPNLGLSPSPEPLVPLPSISPESSPEADDRKLARIPRPSPGHGSLVYFMGGGNHMEVARCAAENPLQLGPEEAEELAKGPVVGVAEVKDKAKERSAEEMEEEPVEKDIAHESMNLAALAAGAVNILRASERAICVPAQEQPKLLIKQEERGVLLDDPMEDVKSTPMPFIKVAYGEEQISPDRKIKNEMGGAPIEELPPMLQQSPKSGQINGSVTLPSISESIGNISHLPQPKATEPIFVGSPPGPSHRFPSGPVYNHGSPSSPNDTFRRELPSPARGGFYPTGPRRPSQIDTPQYTSPIEYSGSNTETPSTDQSTPANITLDRMSIEEITNPQPGGFRCDFPECNAQPFQTQYLLNSHANVHSSVRPHYCSVQGCPRAEGGKGFKRKNEMIRHGLVHDSPGYVCPFCPDREHKYPRPDNLQRHVKVHHVDKDKDDPQLREVLSQRPEGPSRGRRRRGGTGSVSGVAGGAGPNIVGGVPASIAS